MSSWGHSTRFRRPSCGGREVVAPTILMLIFVLMTLLSVKAFVFGFSEGVVGGLKQRIIELSSSCL